MVLGKHGVDNRDLIWLEWWIPEKVVEENRVGRIELGPKKDGL